MCVNHGKNEAPEHLHGHKLLHCATLTDCACMNALYSFRLRRKEDDEEINPISVCVCGVIGARESSFVFCAALVPWESIINSLPI